MFSFLKRRPVDNTMPLTSDIHSHFLAGLDDGVKSLEEAEETIRIFERLGYRKLITTPHIMSDYYRNGPETILPALRELQQFLKDKTDIVLEAAAEYYLDDYAMKMLENQEAFMTFGKKYLLFETNFISEPLQLKEFIFRATSAGYLPVLAHPERYQYMTMAKAEDLRDRGVLFQINSLSTIGFYSVPVQRMAGKLIDQKWVDFLGSDCHSHMQGSLLPQLGANKHYRKALALPLLNHSL